MCSSALIYLIFGFILLVLIKFLSWIASNRGSGGFKGIASVVSIDYKKKSAQVDGAAYRYWLTPGGKNSPPYFHVEFACVSKGEFRITRETGADSFFKQCGVSKEIQTGDTAFDGKHYIWTDCVGFTSAFLSNPEVRNRIRGLFELGFSELGHDGKVLTVQKSAEWGQAVTGEPLAAEAARLMAPLSAAMPVSFPSETAVGDPQIRLKRMVCYFIPLFLLALGALTMIWASTEYRPVAAGEIFEESIRFSGTAFLSFIFFAFMMLRGQSSAHRDLGFILFISLFAFGIAGYGVEAFYNGYADTSNPVSTLARVIERREHRGSKGSRSYDVILESWRPGHQTEVLKVQASEYLQAVPNQSRMNVVTRSGAFGHQWYVLTDLIK